MIFRRPYIVSSDGRPHLFEFREGADLHNKIPNDIYLSDAGVLDNLGIEPLWKICETILISDAGAKPMFEESIWPLWTSMTKRAVDIAFYRFEPIRERLIINNFKNKTRKGTYWSITHSLDNFHLATMLAWNDNLTQALAKMRTRLNRFDDPEQCLLINWGYAVSDAAVRTFVVPEATNKEPNWPYPDYLLSDYSLVEHLQ